MRTRVIAVAAVAATALAANVATAPAAAPQATTGAAGSITAAAATLTGQVNPGGESTRYYFEYGRTRRYGSRTPDASAGSGTAARRVATRLTGLRPNTTYHYRIVALNPSGVTSGADRTFRTRPQPLGLQITATPNPVTFGSATTITGTLTGTGNVGRAVQLQQRPFPYTADWQNVGNAVVTDANGAFSFPLLGGIPATTQFRVRTVETPVVTSEVLTLGLAVRVKTNVSATRVRRGRSVRFSGVIRPARPGAQVAVQKLRPDGRWVVVAGTITRGGSSSFSGFSKRVRIPRGGTYRVFVLVNDGNLESGIGRTIRIRTR
jgi:hypothetical protein